MSDNDSVSSGSRDGELDTTGASVVLNEKSPGKMSNKTPDKQPPPKSGKGVTCSVYLLDGECVEFSLDKNDIGKALFDKVCTHLDLIEKDYFGFTYQDDRGPAHLKYWLDLDKKILKQKKRGAWVFDFALKFYPPDPTHLRESLTRWLVVLQVRRDLLSGRLPCTFTTYALLGSYNVQADIGEYDPSDHGNTHDYIKDMAFAPNQTQDLLEKIAELHKHHKGQTPDEAEKCFLDNSKKLAMYGVDLHNVKDSDNSALMLGVHATGILVFRDKLRLNRFIWPKILKLSYKRNHFYIKIRPREMERNETTIMFKLDNNRLAKRLWKTCVEHHTFFRLRESEKPSGHPTFPRFGSKFRYSGRTLYQSRQSAALLDRPPPYFERSQPARNTFHEDDNRSKSVDELANRRNEDGRDRRDFMDRDPATIQGYGNDGRMGEGDDSTLRKRPIDLDASEDMRDRMPGHGDSTLERPGRHGDDSMGVDAGVGIGLNAQGKPETEKERRKREKEEDKKRKKEAEENKKREEAERKLAEKNKKKGKGGPDTEDRTDKMHDPNATEKAFGVGAGSAGLYGNSSEPDKGKKRFDVFDTIYVGRSPVKKGNAGFPYGVGYGVGKGDLTGVVGDEGTVEQKQHFLPVPAPVKETKDSLKGGYADNMMPFFHPAATSTVGRSKVPPPVAPKHKNSLDDSFNRTDPPTVATEKVKYNPNFEDVALSSRNIPLVKTETRTITYERDGCPSDLDDGILISAQSHSSRSHTVETTTYKTEKDGVPETRMVQKVTVSGDDDDDDYDYDSALADAIRSVTEFNPDMSVERIECVQQIEDVKGGK